MSEQDDQPLDPWVRAALLAEGLDGGPSQAQRARMAGKLAAVLGLSAAALLGGGGGGDGGGSDGGGGGDGGSGGGGGGGGGGAAGAGAAAAGAAGTTIAGKTAALVVGALLAGGGIGAAISELRPRSQPVVARQATPIVIEAPDASSIVETTDTTTDAATDATTDAAIDATTDEASVAARDAAPSASHALHRDAGAARVDAATMTADELARERQLIDVARSALRGGDLQLAAKSLVEHGMRFPHGVLVEEQRVLSIELAVANGDIDGARAKANAFRRDYPRSVFRARVDDVSPP